MHTKVFSMYRIESDSSELYSAIFGYFQCVKRAQSSYNEGTITHALEIQLL